MHHAIAKKCLWVMFSLGVCACGSHSGGGSSTGTAGSLNNASPGGIWTGTDSLTGESLFGVVTEKGQFTFIRSDNSQVMGTIATSGDSLSATVAGAAQLGQMYGDGSTYGTGTVSGTVAERSTMDVTVDFKTAAGTSSTSSVSLTFDALYDQPSSLATLAGSYLETTTGTVFTVSDSGAISAQEVINGCIVNGTLSIIDASYNAYGVSLVFSGCVGDYSVLNGATIGGLAALNTNASPAQLILGVSATVGGQTVALVDGLDKETGPQ